MKKLKNLQHGQGMTEYIIIVAMIAISAIAVYQYFGQTVRNQTASMAEELAGQKNTGQAAAKAAAATAATTANTVNTLETYKDQNAK
jgi:type IV pilus assembly protein PilA